MNDRTGGCAAGVADNGNGRPLEVTMSTGGGIKGWGARKLSSSSNLDVMTVRVIWIT